MVRRRNAGRCSAASSASTGWRVMSLSDTCGRSRWRASPPSGTCRRSRRSCRADRCRRPARRAPSRTRPPASPRWRWRAAGPASPSVAASSAAIACSAFVSILLFGVRGRLSRWWNSDGTMYSGSFSARSAAEHVRSGSAVGGVERHEVLAPVRPLRHDHGGVADAGHRSSALSISPISIRKPRILTWLSRRPRNSSLPSGSQRP